VSHRGWFWLGIVLVMAGLDVIVAGTISPSSDIVVALGWLLFAPLVVMLFGAVCILIGLLRHVKTLLKQNLTRRILAAGAAAGIALSAGFGAAGLVSQVPDWISRANGAFPPGPEGAEGALIIVAVGLVIGVAMGGAVVAVFWFADRREGNQTRVTR
jgi:hypothetical protein